MKIKLSDFQKILIPFPGRSVTSFKLDRKGKEIRIDEDLKDEDHWNVHYNDEFLGKFSSLKDSIFQINVWFTGEGAQ